MTRSKSYIRARLVLALTVGSTALRASTAESSIVTDPTLAYLAPTINLTEKSSVQTGYFDLVVTDTNTSDQFNAFDVDLKVLPGASGITFTSVDLLTSTTPSDFHGSSGPYALASYGAQETGAHSSSTEATNTDTASSNTVGPFLSTSPLGLLRIGFSIPANTTGTFPLNFVTGANNSDAYLVNYMSSTETVLPGIVTNGAITLVAVPEPGSFALAVLAMSGLALRSNLFSRRSKAKRAV